MMPTHQSHTFASRTSRNTSQSLQKSVPVPTHRQKDNAAKIKDKLSKDKNGQLVTRAKSKRADSGNLKGIATNKIFRRLTVLCFEMPASS